MKKLILILLIIFVIIPVVIGLIFKPDNLESESDFVENSAEIESGYKESTMYFINEILESRKEYLEFALEEYIEDFEEDEKYRFEGWAEFNAIDNGLLEFLNNENKKAEDVGNDVSLIKFEQETLEISEVETMANIIISGSKQNSFVSFIKELVIDIIIEIVFVVLLIIFSFIISAFGIPLGEVVTEMFSTPLLTVVILLVIAFWFDPAQSLGYVPPSIDTSIEVNIDDYITNLEESLNLTRQNNLELLNN